MTYAWLQVALCGPILHVSFSSGESRCKQLIPVTLLYFLAVKHLQSA